MVINGKIYEDAKDLHVSGRVFYVKAADSKIYTDSATTTLAEGADVFSAYITGNLVLVNAGSMCVPTACKVADSTVSVDILTVSSSTATVVTATAACASDDTATAALFGQIVPA